MAVLVGCQPSTEVTSAAELSAGCLIPGGGVVESGVAAKPGLPVQFLGRPCTFTLGSGEGRPTRHAGIVTKRFLCKKALSMIGY